MKANNTFTIHTELMDGTLSGVRNIYMGANSTCHLYVIPRDKINVANDIADIAGQPAFYILLGDPNALKPEAYIGQTTDFSNRKNDHVQKKDFWKTALVFISDNHKIYGDDVKYLEYLGIESAQSVESFTLPIAQIHESLILHRTVLMIWKSSSVIYSCSLVSMDAVSLMHQ